MSLQGKHTPLSINFTSGLLSGTGVNVNASVRYLAGESQFYSDYTPGSLINDTCLNDLVNATQLAYSKIGPNLTTEVYDNLISIGQQTIPLLGNSKPASYEFKYEGQIAKFGFVRMIALQAFTEMEVSSGSFSDFCSSFTQCYSYKNRINKMIGSMSNSQSYLDGIYSNMNDLVTSDITGVNLATTYWGQDLIRLGRAIDLSEIDRFGTPSVLLKTLQRSGAITNTLGTALILCGLTTSEIGEILSNIAPVTEEQEKKIYVAFQIIQGVDLAEILTAMNVQTSGLLLLSDLLNPSKIFPNSYNSLTTPKYNSIRMATNSKTYYFIYDSGGINLQLQEFGFKEKYNNVIPNEIAIACGAFSNAMMQIKNIKKMNFEKFAQVVANLETMKDLEVNGTSTPIDSSLINSAKTTIAVGSGTDGSYTMADFYGAMAGVSYKLAELKDAIIKLQTPALKEIYSNMVSLLNGAGPYTSALQTLIDQANIEIANIQNTNKSYTTVSADLFTNQLEYTDYSVTVINTLWEDIGTKLSTEIKARVAALPDDPEVTGYEDVIAFAEAVVNVYALDTSLHGTASIIERIMDMTTPTGNYGVAAMRETRNAVRLGLIGGTLDNNIDYALPNRSLPNALDLTKVTGDTNVLGSLGGSPETLLIPKNLDIFNVSATLMPSVYKPDDASTAVFDGNCNCWS